MNRNGTLARGNFNWNDIYIATTTPGRTYAGRLVGRDGEAMMMRSDDDCIFIGRARDIDTAIRSGERVTFQATGKNE